MADVTYDTDSLTASAHTLRVWRGQAQPDRVAPDVTGCGSVAVADAFARAFQMINAQDATTYTTWADLGEQLLSTVEEIERVDALLAGGY